MSDNIIQIKRPGLLPKALANRIIIDPIEAPEAHNGVLVPEKYRPEMPEGIVVGLGSGRRPDGETYPFEVQIGDRVVHKIGVAEVKIGGHMYRIVQEEDVLAILP